MIIRYASDIHLEHIHRSSQDSKKIIPEFEDDSNSVIVIPGDVSNGRYGRFFLEELCDRFRYVIFVMGNHDYYGKDISTAAFKYDSKLDRENFILLDNSRIIVDGVRFIGATLWTDMKNSDQVTMDLARQRMNDYHHISDIHIGGTQMKNYRSKFQPERSVDLHRKTMRYFKKELSTIPANVGEFHTTIIVTHHLPSYACVDPKFLNDPLGPVYASNLNDFIAENNIDYWIHGHTHDRVDIEFSGTRIKCDPKGYDDMSSFNGSAFIQIDTDGEDYAYMY